MASLLAIARAGRGRWFLLSTPLSRASSTYITTDSVAIVQQPSNPPIISAPAASIDLCQYTEGLIQAHQDLHFHHLHTRMLAIYPSNPKYLASISNSTFTQWYHSFRTSFFASVVRATKAGVAPPVWFETVFPKLRDLLITPTLDVLEHFFKSKLSAHAKFKLIEHVIVLSEERAGKFFLLPQMQEAAADSFIQIKEHLQDLFKVMFIVATGKHPSNLYNLDNYKVDTIKGSNCTKWGDVPLNFQISSELLLLLDKSDCPEAFFRVAYFRGSDAIEDFFPLFYLKTSESSTSKLYRRFLHQNSSTGYLLLNDLLNEHYKRAVFDATDSKKSVPLQSLNGTVIVTEEGKKLTFNDAGHVLLRCRNCHQHPSLFKDAPEASRWFNLNFGVVSVSHLCMLDMCHFSSRKPLSGRRVYARINAIYDLLRRVRLVQPEEKEGFLRAAADHICAKIIEAYSQILASSPFHHHVTTIGTVLDHADAEGGNVCVQISVQKAMQSSNVVKNVTKFLTSSHKRPSGFTFEVVRV